MLAWSLVILLWQACDSVFTRRVASRTNIQSPFQIELVKNLMFTRCQRENILRHFLLNKGLDPPSHKSKDASSKQMLSIPALVLCFVLSLQFVSFGSTVITGQPWTCVQLRQSTESKAQESCWIFKKHFSWMIILFSKPKNSGKWRGSAFSNCFWAPDHSNFKGEQTRTSSFQLHYKQGKDLTVSSRGAVIKFRLQPLQK